jgi:hypothetical protein
MRKGDRVRLIPDGGDIAYGVLLLCSPCQDSLMVALEDGMRTRSGLYADMVPLLRQDGVYRDLMGNDPVEVALIEQGGPAA